LNIEQLEVCNSIRTAIYLKHKTKLSVQLGLSKSLIIFRYNNIWKITPGSSWGSIENWLEPKTKPPSGNLACPKSVKCYAVPFKVTKNTKFCQKQCYVT